MTTTVIFNSREYYRFDLGVKIRSPCQECGGLGDIEDDRGFLVVCPNCLGAKTMELAAPKPVLPLRRIIDSDGVKDDGRTQAALDAFQDASRKMATWRNAVRAALKAADAAVGRKMVND